MQIVSMPPHLQHLFSYHGISSASRGPGSSCAFGIIDVCLIAHELCAVVTVCSGRPGMEWNGAERYETERWVIATVQVSGLVEGPVWVIAWVGLAFGTECYDIDPAVSQP